MKKTRRKIMTGLVTFAMVVAMTFGQGITAFATEDTSLQGTDETYDIWVGGVQVTDSNAGDVLGDGTVSYDADANKLTLKDTEITDGYEYNEDSMAGIYVKGDINIVLQGDGNKITAPDTTKRSRGIDVKGRLYISGDGTLVAAAGAVTSTENDADSTGIYVQGDMQISGAFVISEGGVASASDDNYAYSNGVYVEGNVDIDEEGSLVANADEASGYVAYSSGIEVYGEEDNYINLSVHDGYLEATGAKATGDILSGSVGIYLFQGGLYTYTNDATVILNAGTAEATSTDTSEHPYAYSNGAYVYLGDVSFNGGTITMKGDAYSGMDGDNFGLYVKGDVTVDDNGEVIGSEGGTVYIGSDVVEPNLYTPSFLGTKVDITSPSDIAIWAENGIEIGDELVVTTPDKGVAKGIGDAEDLDYWTVVDEEGQEAKNVVIEPLIYKVSIKGLSYSRAVSVAAGESVNDTYCDLYRVDDFSEILNTDKEGYTFVGWYTDEACTAGNEYSFDVPVTADVTIYPKWEEKVEDTEATTTEDGTEATTEKTTETTEDNSTASTEESSSETTEESTTEKTDDTPGTGDNIHSFFFLLLVSGSVLLVSRFYGRQKDEQ